MKDELLKRFFQYVKIDTQSREDAGDQYPSTEKQKDLGRVLVEELKGLGLQDVVMDSYGYVTGKLSGNLSEADNKKVPVIGLLGHLDTSPEVSGKNVKPVLHENYQGQDIVLPGDKTQIIRTADNPDLKEKAGEDIISSDGTTLLGADNKAGIAEIMTTLSYLQSHPEIKHGELRIAFTPDEEVGQGTKYFNAKKFGAEIAYTVDGEKAGDVENETFNAASALFTIQGINVHPGYAKDKMVNAIRIASELVEAIKDYPAPENTEKHEGYIHPYVIQGGVGETTVKMLLRDFEMSGIEQKEELLKSIQKELSLKHPEAKIELKLERQYKNMRFVLEKHPDVVENALEAVQRTGLKPRLQIIRGGTDGARLCYEGLPTPNLFTGGHNFHSKSEWISVQDMEKAVKTLVNLVQIWVEKCV